MARLFNDGSSQYLTTGTPIITAPPFTLAAWANIDDVAVRSTVLMLGDNASPNFFTNLRIEGNVADDPIVFDYRGFDSGQQTTVKTSTGVSVNTWHHVCGVAIANNSAVAYIDGGSTEAESDTSFSGFAGNLDHTAIGVLQRDTNTLFMSGMIAEAAIWSAALTGAEVAILATGLSPLAVRPQSLIAYWPLIGRTSPEIDRVGGYDMTLTAGPTAAAHPPVRYPVSPMMVHAPAVSVDRLPLEILRPNYQEQARIIAALQL